MAKLQMSSLIICLMTICCIGTINSAVSTGYFYDRPYNPPSLTPLRSVGQYSSIPYGQKVETNTQTRLKVPPIPSLPPLTTYIPKQTTQYGSAYGKYMSSTPTYYNVRTLQQQQQQAQQAQRFQQQQQQTTQYQIPQQKIVQPIQQYQRPQQKIVQQIQQQQQQSPQPYSYPKPQIPVNTQLISNNQQQSTYTLTQQQQQRNNIPQPLTKRPSTQSFQNTQIQVVPSQVVKIPSSSVIKTESNPKQTTAGLQLASPDIYVVDGRQLKQYKVYEHIDNDIDQEVQNFLPANFFLNTYHSMIGDTHPLGEEIQVQNRASGFQRSQQLSPPTPTTIALGSGGLGFVKLPNGNVYLGSGSLGYISSLQHSQDVQDLRSRTSSSGPDALHFGHGSLSDSFYYRNQKD